MMDLRALNLKMAMGTPITLEELRGAVTKKRTHELRSLANVGTVTKKRKHAPNRTRYVFKLDGVLVCLHPTKGYRGVYGNKGRAKKSRRNNGTHS